MITPEQIAKSGTEHGQQAALFQWAALNIKQYPQLKWLFAVPNGFYSTPGQKAKMKAEGLKDGVPDVLLPVRSRWTMGSGWVEFRYNGLAIEMKVGKNKTSKEQEEWIDHLENMNWQCHVCYSWEEARDKIMEYLNVST